MEMSSGKSSSLMFSARSRALNWFVPKYIASAPAAMAAKKASFEPAGDKSSILFIFSLNKNFYQFYEIYQAFGILH